MAAISSPVPTELDQQISAVAQKRIYFGHQSVGANILDGIRDLAALRPELPLKIVHSADPGSVSGSGLFESPVGQNGDPESKNQSFARVVEKGFGAQSGIALYKYCYVDFSAHTDVQAVLARYRQSVDELKAKYPLLKIVHVTVPLTSVEPAGKAWLKSVLGRDTMREANARRNEFNHLLKESYRNDPIFDLAEVESTHPNGSRESFTSGGQTIYSLCPEYTIDGGHLNRVGRQAAARRLLITLANL